MSDSGQQFELMGQQFTFREFAPGDQAAVRELILEGLTERWGQLEEGVSPDLDEIAATYRDGFFVTMWTEGVLVGTGGILPEGEGVCRVARMSVKRSLRGAGLGQAILDALVAWAAERQARRVVLEATSSWEEAVNFFRNCGFDLIGEDGENTHFELALENHRRPW